MPASNTSPASGPTIDVVVDGHRATLVELTKTHLLVHSQTGFKPEHKVRIVLRQNDTVLRLRAVVLSAKFEMPKEGPRYKVQLEFEGETGELDKILP